MDAKPDLKTTSARASDREFAVTRLFRAPAEVVFAAWTQADRLMRWWTPKSLGMTFLTCEIDARVGGGYRFVFSHPDSAEPMVFHGA